MSTIRSPDGAYEARLYYLNPGAAASSADRMDIVDMTTGKSRELWFGPPDVEPPQWIDARTVAVGEQELDIRGEPFDWYKDQPVGGYGSPEEAARAFATAVALDDLASARGASGPILTAKAFSDLRIRLLSADASASVSSIKLMRDPRITAIDQREYFVEVRLLRGSESRVLKLESLVQWESGKWRAESLDPEGTY